MANINYPAAFPWRDPNTGIQESGLSLRDWFAGQVIGHIYASVTSDQKVAWFEEIAAQAYHIADAMLAAREA